MPLWKHERDDQGQDVIIITEAGKEWLKQQLTAYRDENKQDILYENGHGVVRGLRAGE